MSEFPNVKQLYIKYVIKRFLCSFGLCLLLSACSAIMPDVTQIIDDMTDTAIRIDIAKEALMQDTDIYCEVKVIQKDEPKPITVVAQKN